MNYLLLDTATPICRVSIIKNDSKLDYEWQADRALAHGLLSHLTGLLSENDLNFDDLSGIGALRGPGSFTGLRIGLTVLNTIADSQNIPIVGADGDDWQRAALERLEAGESDQIVLPLYGRDARITSPRK